MTPSTDYPALFRSYIIQRLNALRDVVPQDAFVRSRPSQEQALRVLDYALTEPTAWGSTRELLLLMGPKMEQAGYRVGWIHFLLSGIEQSHRQNDHETEAHLHLLLARLYQATGQFEAATDYAQRASARFQTIGDMQGHANALGRLAYAFLMQSQYDEAQRLTEVALTLLPAQDRIRGSIYNVQFSIALRQGRRQEALDAAKQALGIWTREGDDRMVAWTLRDTGFVLYKEGQIDEAITACQRALDIFARIYDPVHEASTRMNLGIIYVTNGNGTEALRLFALAEPVFKQTHDQVRLARLYTNRGYALRLTQQFKAAVDSLQTAIALWNKLNQPLEAANALDELGLAYCAQGKIQDAITVLQRALGLLEHRPPVDAVHILRRDLVEHLAMMNREQPQVACAVNHPGEEDTPRMTHQQRRSATAIIA